MSSPLPSLLLQPLLPRNQQFNRTNAAASNSAATTTPDVHREPAINHDEALHDSDTIDDTSDGSPKVARDNTSISPLPPDQSSETKEDEGTEATKGGEAKETHEEVELVEVDASAKEPAKADEVEDGEEGSKDTIDLNENETTLNQRNNSIVGEIEGDFPPPTSQSTPLTKQPLTAEAVIKNSMKSSEEARKREEALWNNISDDEEMTTNKDKRMSKKPSSSMMEFPKPPKKRNTIIQTPTARAPARAPITDKNTKKRANRQLDLEDFRGDVAHEEPPKKRKLNRRKGPREEDPQEEEAKKASRKAEMKIILGVKQYHFLYSKKDSVKARIADELEPSNCSIKKKIGELYGNRMKTARDQLTAIIERSRSCTSIGAKRKAMADQSEAACELVKTMAEAIYNIPDSVREVNVLDIAWSDDYEIDNDLVDQYAFEICKSSDSVLDKKIYGWIPNGEYHKVHICTEVEYILALRQLGEISATEVNRGFNTMEEDRDKENSFTWNYYGEQNNPTTTSSQQLPVHSHNDSQDAIAPASQPIGDSSVKKRNPYSYVFINIIISAANSVISPEEVCLYKSTMKPLEKERLASQKALQARQIMKTLKIDPLTMDQKTIRENLRRRHSHFICDTIIRAIELESALFDKLISALKIMRTYKLDVNGTIQSYCNARKISPQHADKTIANIVNRSKTVEEGKQELKDIASKIKYKLMGKGVKKDDAEFIEGRLEQSPWPKKAITYLTGKKRALAFETMQEWEFDKDRILQVLERQLNPCLAFTQPTINHRAENNGFGTEKCVVNFITYQDLKQKPAIFKSCLGTTKNKKTAIFFITNVGTDCNVITDLGWKDTVGLYDAVVKIRNFVHGTRELKHDGVKCVVVGGEGPKDIWGKSLLEKNLRSYNIIGDTISNTMMRQLVYQAPSVLKPAKKGNKNNSVFLHSISDEILSIVANMAMNRIFTSADPKAMGPQLIEKQMKITERRTTFPKPDDDEDKKKKKKDDEDSEDGDETCPLFSEDDDDAEEEEDDE